MDQRTEKFLETKNKATTRTYRRAFDLFYEFTETRKGEKLTGEDLIKLVAEDRRRSIEDRKRPEINLLKEFFNWLKKEAPKARSEEIGYSPKTCHAYLSGITEFLNYHDLPVSKKKLSLPKPTRKKNNRKINIRRTQVRQLVNHAKTNRDKAVILCLWQSGMSISDLLALNVSDVKIEDPVRGSLDNPPILIKLSRKKSGIDYRTFFGQDACESLKRYLEERERTVGKPKRTDLLFLQERQKNNEGYERLTVAAAEMMFRRVAEKSGLVSKEKMKEADFNPARPHALRAGFSSVLKEEGVNQSIIDGLTGHSVGYDSAYHNFSDKQLRELYEEHEDVLSIEQVSIPKEDEIEEAVRKHFGEMGVERIMPDVKEQLKNQEKRISELEEEVKNLRSRSTRVLSEIVSEEEAEKIVEAAKKIVEGKS